jgi:hypothetical protein
MLAELKDNTMDFKSQVMFISPSYAKSLLENNKNNRAIRKKVVKKYAKDMTDGNWQLTPQGIILNKQGNLLDGQHRLSAVIEAGVSVPMNVTFDVDAETPIGIMLDVGAKREISDIIGASKREVAAARLLISIATGKNKTDVTAFEVDRFLNIFEDLKEFTNIPVSTNFLRSAIIPAAGYLAMFGRLSKHYIKDRMSVIFEGDFKKFTKSEESFYKWAAQITERRTTHDNMIDYASRYLPVLFDTDRKKCTSNKRILEFCARGLYRKLEKDGFIGSR